MHFLLFYEKSAGYAERQKPLVEAHRAYLGKAVENGELLLGGNVSDPADGAAVLLYGCATKEHVERWAREDPYVVHGIVSRWWVRPWDTVIGAMTPTTSVIHKTQVG